MDPYLEAGWGDVRARLVVYACDQLQPLTPADLRARVNEREVLEAGSGSREEPMTETFIEIIDIGSVRRVVTVIEVLSVSDKMPSDAQNKYFARRRELFDCNVSLVEIDLLRKGQHVVAVPEKRIPPTERTPHRVCVRRGSSLDFELYPLRLRERLPAIRIPLRTTDADVPLDLQALIDQCYRNGGYDEDIDYTIDPVPPLESADAAWADELLRSKGLR
jgi:hypothetical protein